MVQIIPHDVKQRQYILYGVTHPPVCNGLNIASGHSGVLTIRGEKRTPKVETSLITHFLSRMLKTTVRFRLLHYSITRFALGFAYNVLITSILQPAHWGKNAKNVYIDSIMVKQAC